MSLSADFSHKAPETGSFFVPLYLGKVYINKHNILCFLLTFILSDVIMANVGRFLAFQKYSMRKVGVIYVSGSKKGRGRDRVCIGKDQ